MKKEVVKQKEGYREIMEVSGYEGCSFKRRDVNQNVSYRKFPSQCFTHKEGLLRLRVVVLPTSDVVRGHPSR